jgi:Domain of unknown function (DUF4338)/DDE_Tnp_1-associated
MKTPRKPTAASSCVSKAEPAIEVRAVEPEELARFESLLKEGHYLGPAPPVGDFLRQVALRKGQWVGLLVWGPAAYKLKDRERWIGWSVPQRLERLKLVVQNRRFLLLSQKGAEPNWASQVLGAACKALGAHWRQRFGYAPLVAESFSDPEAYAGTCYKASGWEPLGMSQGHSRHRPEFYVPNQRPKRLWLKALCPQARQRLCALALAPEDAPATVAIQNGVLPLSPPQVRSLFEVLRQAPDPRAKNTQFRIGAVLTLIALAILAGARDIAQIARFATRLHPKQRAALGLPRKTATKGFYRVPGYNVFYQVLSRLEAEAFARLLNDWLQRQAGGLPAALALDGKMIRDHIGMVTLADHEDGSPMAVALMDQKEGTQRCEQTAALSLLESLPTLEQKVVSADALHCQKATARVIVEKGGEYLLQIKANQPALLKQAEAAGAVSSPLLPRPTVDTVGSRSAA